MAAVIAVLGCGRDDDAVYDRNSTVTIADADGARFLNPDFDHPARFLLFLPLITYSENGELQGRLARSWEHSADYREWTIHLRSDVRWHDGMPVTAHDIKFTYELLTHPDVLELRPDLYEWITVHDDSTYTMRYPGPDDGPDSWMVYYPKHLLEGLDIQNAYNWEFWTHPVGNGPYRFVRYLRDTVMEQANPDYYGGKPRIEHVLLKFVGGAGLTELLSGNVDAITYADPAQIPKLAGDPRFRVYYHRSGIEGVARAVYWQHAHPFLGDPRVRRALTLAVDRRELRQLLYLPESTPILDGVFTKRQLRRGKLPDPLPYDPTGARALLDAAGWHDGDGDGVRKREGREARFSAIVATLPQFREIAVYIQDQLQRVGVRMEIQAAEKIIVLERLRRGEFEAAVTFFVHEPHRLRQFLGAGSPLGYRNARVVELIDRAVLTGDPDETERIYRELSEIWRAEMPVTLFFPRVEAMFVHRRLRGLSSPWRANPTWHMADLWLEDE